MKKIRKKFYFGLFIALFFLLFCPSKVNAYEQYDYVINHYNIDVIVNENNTFQITEEIQVMFNTKKHGIYRTIPLKNQITRTDGTTSKNRAKITDVSVNHSYTTSKENGNYKIKIGDENITFTGPQTYEIKYTYHLGKDPMKDYDEFYYNLVGNEWDTQIQSLSFKVTMPKTFDQNKLGFSRGKKGETKTEGIYYYVSGNQIIGSYNNTLEPGEGVSIRCELEEGYFASAQSITNPIENILLFLPILFLVVSVFLWYKYGRDEQVIETVEFYPPNGFNSLEVGFLYKGNAEQEDVTSLLIYLANRGYIKITEEKKQTLFSKKNDFKITKLKEYDGNNYNEQLFLNGLFKTKNEVTSMDLYDNFYLTMDQILTNINTKENKNKIFETSASSKKIFIVLMILFSFFLITLFPILAFSEIYMLIPALLFPGIGFSLMIHMLSSGPQTIYVNGSPKKSSFGTKAFGLVWGLLFGGMPWAFTVLPALLQEPIYLVSYLIGLICITGMIVCLKYLPKRTKFGNEMLGKIKGFKTFLETVEKERLEAMVKQYPAYFYHILPYTYVLGISDTWIKKFESIALQAPNWYDNSSAFDIVVFESFMNNTMSSAQDVMSYSSAAESDTGGSSSGGGSGGGGGGSW